MEQRNRAIVLGLDGGGTHTRVLAADLTGKPLACVETGGCSPQHNADADAEANTRQAILQAVTAAGCELSDVVCLVGGMAGLDGDADLLWAERYTAVPGLHCPRTHVNDSVVAHTGALGSHSGIIIVAGTGAITFGVTETGRAIRNYDFNQYADSAGRTLAANTVYRLLIGDDAPADSDLVRHTLGYWKVADVAALRERVMAMSPLDWKVRVHHYGGMAPLVTEAAAAGSPLARKVCDRAIDEMAVSIRLIGNCFETETVSVAPIGSVAQSPYMRQTLAEVLSAKPERRYQVVSPRLPPEAGAVLMALQQIGISPDETILNALRQP